MDMGRVEAATMDLIEKRFYNREANSAALCNIVNVFQTPLPFFATEIINLFLNSMIPAYHNKG